MASGYRNALPFLSEEDVPGVCFIHIKLEKHSVDQLRRWLARRGIKKSWNKPRCQKEKHYEVTNAVSFVRTPLPKLSYTRYPIVVGLLGFD